MSLRPSITVAAISERDGRFLLVEELIERRRVLNQPAGHVEDRETLVEAVVRETLEESAWTFTPTALLGIYLWRNPRDGRSTLRFAFCGDVEHHDSARTLDRGILATHWMAATEMARTTMPMRSPLVLRCVTDYIAGQRLPLSTVAHLDLQSAAVVRPLKAM